MDLNPARPSTSDQAASASVPGAPEVVVGSSEEDRGRARVEAGEEVSEVASEGCPEDTVPEGLRLVVPDGAVPDDRREVGPDGSAPPSSGVSAAEAAPERRVDTPAPSPVPPAADDPDAVGGTVVAGPVDPTPPGP